MRKVYLLITAAMLLIGSSSAFADLVATVGEQEFKTGTGEGEYATETDALVAALEASTADNYAILQKNANVSTITINEGKEYYLSLGNKKSLTANSELFTLQHGSLYVEGEGTLSSSYVIYIYGSTDENANKYSVLKVGKDVTLNAPTGSGVVIYNNNKCAFGVVVDIYGKIISRWFGITTNGSIQKTEGAIPQITLHPDAMLFNDDTTPQEDKDNKTGKVYEFTGSYVGIYAAGYANWKLNKCTIVANTPIYSKAGVFEVDGATLHATGNTYDAVPYNNGCYTTGDGITLDSKNGYAGMMSLDVKNSTITSDKGCAIQEVITDRTDKKGKLVSGTIKMSVYGDDTAMSGAEGTIVVSEQFKDYAYDGSSPIGWVENSISSGKYSAAPEVVADGYEVVVTADAQFPYSVQRMTEPIIPQESTEYITENTTSATVRTVGTTETDKFAVIVKSGVTYEVEGLVVGNNAETEAKVVVEPGATLIVGASGIITHKAGNLILKADREHGTAKLIFKDANSINTNPLATVELYLRARTLNAETKAQLWQHYGLPVSYDEGLTSVEKNFGVNYNNWIVGRGWKYVAGTDMLSEGAWAGHNITTNASVEGSIIRFKGQLIGRDNKELNFVPGYSCFTNSYSAPLSLRSLRSKLNASGVAEPVIWIYDVSYAPTFRLVNNSFKDNDFLDKGIASMQAFFIPSESSAHSLTIDYQNDVIGFSNGSVKEAEVSEYNGGTIVLSDGFNNAELIITEGDEFSDAYDRGWDANLMPGITPAIFVAEGTAKYASLATNAIEGKKISIITNNATEYTLSFKFLEGKAFKLKDLASGAEIEVSAESTYRFTAEANSTIERFELLEGTVAANEADANSVNVWVANNNLNIAGAAEGDAIEAINLAGVKIISAAATGEAVQAISLSGIASGAYIVKVGAATVKVIK